MPIHDWTRVDAGTFHAFHLCWIAELMETLNTGILPDGYYAMGEQVASRREPDVFALRVSTGEPTPAAPGVALLESAPKVRVRLRANTQTMYHRKTRSIVIRHSSGHEIVALIEIISRANKDRASHVADIVTKVSQFLSSGVHVLMIDLLPPGKHDPTGIHGKVWEQYDNEEAYVAPAGETLALASYECTPVGPEAYVEPTAVGQVLIDMPVFLQHEFYVNVPLEATYMAAYRGMPRIWRDVLEGKNAS